MATFKELESKVNELKREIESMKRNQITFPLDKSSLDTIQRGLLKYENKQSSTVTADKAIRITINGESYQINVK